ncbi:SDR family oxidoreductase [Streptomyces sp. I05A-00742]|uniref:SDR family oxidoreductase n=1 Tax=Streptomyces sp. I05A-00742 TaxID=2732853 RepID=UPI00148986DE|nr:SDR family oxidoreductase [Streptomyces sp. I05A-00742]
MTLDNRRVVITGAARDFGRTLAISFARLGAEVFLSARSLEGAERTRDEIRGLGHERVHAFACDIGDPASVRAFTAAVRERTDAVDILVNNGAAWLEGEDLLSADDDAIVATASSAVTGTALVTKHFLPLLRASARPDIVTMVSACGTANYSASGAHSAYYGAKAGQGAFTGILSKRLRAEGIRVISLFPPDFTNVDPLSPEWETTPRDAHSPLTAQSLVDCVVFAVRQQRDCFINAFHFEDM